MDQGLHAQQALNTRVIGAIRDYGPIVDLRVGRGELLGSLGRLEAALQGASRSGDQKLARLAADAQQVLRERERRNGTPEERNDPDGFANLTDATKRALSAIYDYLTEDSPC